MSTNLGRWPAGAGPRFRLAARCSTLPVLLRLWNALVTGDP
jgi:hypothetical protein